MRLSFVSGVVLIALFAPIMACKPKLDVANDRSETSALLNDDQIGTISQIMAKSVLINQAWSVQFKWDGCQARAYLLAAELAAEGIPSSAFFAESDSYNGKSFEVKKDGKVVAGWSYHVAPLFIKSTAKGVESFIIDPVMNNGDNTPIKVERWKSLFGADIPKVLYRTVLLPGSCYVDEIDTPNTDKPLCNSKRLRNPDFRTVPDEVVRSMSDMPKFSVNYFNESCRKLHEIIGKNSQKEKVLEIQNTLKAHIHQVGKNKSRMKKHDQIDRLQKVS
jgi:hypothetical protein